MAVEKVGVYRKWLGPVPQNARGHPLPKSSWPRKRRYRWSSGGTGRRVAVMAKCSRSRWRQIGSLPKDPRNRLVPVATSCCQWLANLQTETPAAHPYTFIRPECLERVRARIAAGRWRPGAEVVNNVARGFEMIRCRAKVQKCTPHDLRRSAITNWAHRLPIHVVQTLAGHASITTTRRYYLAVRPEDLRLASRTVDELTARTGGQTDTILTPQRLLELETNLQS